jgi:uncharacterized protein (TIGR03905 family)
MIHKTFYPTGVCCRQIDYELDDKNCVHNVHFHGGCAGNTVGVAKLCENRPAEEIIKILSGIPCTGRASSCPNELANSLAKTLKEKK